jgi:integrase/recombinase XerD
VLVGIPTTAQLIPCDEMGRSSLSREVIFDVAINLLDSLRLIVCVLQIMLDTLFLRSSALERHRDAPLLRERELYLCHLESQGRSRQKLRDAASYLLQIVQRLKLTRMRAISLEELRVAADHWRRRSEQPRAGGQLGRSIFLRHAKGWFRFHGRLIEPTKWNVPLDERVALFKRYLRIELGFVPRTVDGKVWTLNRFLSWLADHEIQLRWVSVAHVEQYFDYLDGRGWKSTTIASTVQSLKVFFRFAARQGWSRKGISGGIFGPLIIDRPKKRRGPEWTDVCRLIENTTGTTARDYRARAILLLISLYALRAREVTNLLLSDIDFNENVLTIRRSKNRLTQRFPLEPNVRSALQEYIQKKRPQSELTQVFLTLRRPHGPIYQASLYNLTKTGMNLLNIKSLNKGPHSLRHACANHLLCVGTPIGRVASLLGHVGTRYIGSYIQHTVADLRPIADFPLGELWT